MPHLVTTDKQKVTISRGNQVEKQKNDVLKYISNEMSHVVYLDDAKLNPTIEDKQLGHVLSSTEMEARLRKILPSSCVFIDNPWRFGFRAVVRLTREGQETLVPYEKGPMPEHSVMSCNWKEVPDPDYISRKRALGRDSLTKHEWVPGEGFVFDENEPRPGFLKVRQIGRELKRGWRTVLIKLIQSNVLTLGDAERYFGSDDFPTWQYHTGKTAEQTVIW